MQRLAIILAATGMAVIATGRVYHFTQHPEWTEPQALVNLWHTWLLGAVYILGAGLLLWVGAYGKRNMRKE